MLNYGRWQCTKEDRSVNQLQVQDSEKQGNSGTTSGREGVIGSNHVLHLGGQHVRLGMIGRISTFTSSLQAFEASDDCSQRIPERGTTATGFSEQSDGDPESSRKIHIARPLAIITSTS